MAKQIILVTGGARSGKSKYAEQRAAALGRRRLYVATAEAKDEEMAQRIAEHKRRRGDEWTRGARRRCLEEAARGNRRADRPAPVPRPPGGRAQIRRVLAAAVGAVRPLRSRSRRHDGGNRRESTGALSKNC